MYANQILISKYIFGSVSSSRSGNLCLCLISVCHGDKLRIVCFFSLIFRNRAAVSLFWDFWAPLRLLSDHKIGRKLPFGKKHHLMGFRNI